MGKNKTVANISLYTVINLLIRIVFAYFITDKTPVVVGIVRNEHLDGIRANWNTVDLDVDKLTT